MFEGCFKGFQCHFRAFHVALPESHAMPSGILPGIFSGNPSGVAPEIFPGISSDILSGIHPGMFFSGFLQESVGIRPEISSITPSGFFF